MKKYLFGLLLVALVVVPFVGQTATLAELQAQLAALQAQIASIQQQIANLTSGQPSITVLSPNGGETWQSGQTVKIRWQTVGMEQNVPTQLNIIDDRISGWTADSLFGSSPVLNYAQLVSSTNGVNTYEYNFLVPQNFNLSLPAQYQNVFAGKHYKIEVIALVGGIAGTNSQQIKTDYSNSPFTIVSPSPSQPSIKVLSPNGGESYKIGDTISARWTSQNIPSNHLLSVYLYNPTRGNVSAFTTSVANNQYQFSLTNDLRPGSYKINVCDSTLSPTGLPGKSLCDSSDNFFTVTSSTQTSATEEDEIPKISNISVWGLATNWEQGLTKTVSWWFKDIPKESGLKYRVGLYTDKNGGMWGNSVYEPIKSSGDGNQRVDLSAGVSVDPRTIYYVRVRLVKADNSDYRVNGQRVEARVTKNFFVTAPSIRTSNNSCGDSDNGDNPDVKGTVTLSIGGVVSTYTDSCGVTDPYKVTENFCRQGRHVSSAESCALGKACRDGACVVSTSYLPAVVTVPNTINRGSNFAISWTARSFGVASDRVDIMFCSSNVATSCRLAFSSLPNGNGYTTISSQNLLLSDKYIFVRKTGASRFSGNGFSNQFEVRSSTGSVSRLSQMAVIVQAIKDLLGN